MRFTSQLIDSIVRKIMDDVSRIDYDAQQRQVLTAWALSVMPPAVAAVWNDPALREYVATFYFSQTLVCGAEDAYVTVDEIPLPDSLHDSVPEEVCRQLIELEQKNDVQNEARVALWNRLRALLKRYSTVERFRAAVPELARYVELPDALESPQNVVAELAKQGWTGE